MVKMNIKNLKNFEGKEVCLQAWVYQFRSSGKISFVILRDGSGYCQCVFTKVSPETSEALSQLTLETSVEVRGKVKKWKEAYELEGSQLKILSLSEAYPLGKKSHGVDFLMSHRHLWLRSKRQRAIMNVRSELIYNIHQFFYKEGFLQVDPPLLTPNACEGTTSLFEVNFFDQDQVYLSQSGQLYMEAAAAAYGKAYSFGPTFRAEKSSTRRHLLEFWMIEPEMAFCDYKEAMEVAENFLEYVVQNTINKREEEFRTLERDINKLKVVKAPFPKISYVEACEKIQKSDGNFKMGGDLGAKEETFISSQFSSPLFIHHYPKEVKAFYMKEDLEDPQFSLSFDLLATEGYGELIGGGQREDSLEKVENGIKNHNLRKEDFEWYLDLRRYGSFLHSGFGLGLERLVSWVCGLDHVRESIPFPRVYGRSFFEREES